MFFVFVPCVPLSPTLRYVSIVLYSSLFLPCNQWSLFLGRKCCFFSHTRPMVTLHGFAGRRGKLGLAYLFVQILPPPPSVSFCQCLSLSVSVSLSVCLSLSLSPSVCLPVSVCLSFSVSVSLFALKNVYKNECCIHVCPSFFSFF